MRRTYPFIFRNLAHFLDHYFMLIFPTAVLAAAIALPNGRPASVPAPAE